MILIYTSRCAIICCCGRRYAHRTQRGPFQFMKFEIRFYSNNFHRYIRCEQNEEIATCSGMYIYNGGKLVTATRLDVKTKEMSNMFLRTCSIYLFTLGGVIVISLTKRFIGKWWKKLRICFFNITAPNVLTKSQFNIMRYFTFWEKKRSTPLKPTYILPWPYV